MGCVEGEGYELYVLLCNIIQPGCEWVGRVECDEYAQHIFGATLFSQDLSGWDVSKVTDMSDMFSGAISFNQDISEWDVSSVTGMRDMFRGATAFNHDLSGWDVSKVTEMSFIFRDASVLTRTLQRTMHVSSFFEGVYRRMSKEKRRQAFAAAFPWQRRRAFMLFLVNHGYLYSAHVASNYEREFMPCDAIFDVEDIYRYICQFL